MGDNTNPNLSIRRDYVVNSFKAQESKNLYEYSQGNIKATSKYIYDNQKSDAHEITDRFYKNNYRVVSVNKRTKVGADGLMIMVMYLMATHCDDDFVLNPSNVLILTGMSNTTWEKDMKEKLPECFKDNVYHHGKLTKAKKKLRNLKNSLIIIDEIDTGNKEDQKLHTLLRNEGIMDAKHMIENNNRFVVISATMMHELYELYTWGPELYTPYTMEIPPEYIGHGDFLKMDVIQEFYPLNTKKNVERWIDEDILDNYKSDYRVHIVRMENQNISKMEHACIKKGVEFRLNTSDDRLTDEDNRELFEKPLSKHVVICIKGFFRRATLIPNKYKLRIGAIHERYVSSRVDFNVQVQGLPGRMTGYWKDDIEKGHKIGPYRTSKKAIEAYEKCIEDPYGVNSYYTRNFNKKNGKVKNMKQTMLSSNNIDNLEPIGLPVAENKNYKREVKVFHTKEECDDFVINVTNGRETRECKKNEQGFKECTMFMKKVHTLEEVEKFCHNSELGSNLDGKKEDMKVGQYLKRRYVCYEDINDIKTERYVVNSLKRIA